MKEHNKISGIIKSMVVHIKKFYSTHFIGKLLATIAVLCVVTGIISYIPVLGVKENKIPKTAFAGLSQPVEEIPNDSGEVQVAQSDSKLLSLDTKTLNLKLKDKNSGKVWNSSIPGSKQPSELALLTVSYLGKDNNLYEWDTYQYCTSLGSYTLNKISNGVQVILDINEGESNRFYEFYPQKMSTDRFENFFIGGIKTLVKDGKLDEARAAKYEQTIKLIYKKSILENCYAVVYTGTPPTSAVKQLIELAKLLGYTKEMLIKDSEAMGLTVTFVEPASFHITLEATLDGDDFVVRVPTQAMKSDNDYYTIQNVKVLPNFGASAAGDYKDGYIFVPDGAGALFKFNTFNAAVPDYIRPVYDNDYFTDYYFMPEFGEELMMPVFGMTYGTDENSTHGFLGIIERGAETSYINVKLADSAKGSSSSINKAYASFDTAQYHNVKVYGPYSDSQATYLADTGILDVDYCIRYKLFPKKVTYFDMAMAYKDYLMKEWNIKELKYPDKVQLYLDFIGTLTLKKRFLGIPYDYAYSMTTYSELEDIINDLGDKNLTLKYSGFFNGGLKNKLSSCADLTASNGTKKELKNLLKRTQDNNIDLFLEAPLTRIYDKGNGFNIKKHSIYDFSNTAASIYRYLIPLGILNGISDSGYNHYYLLSPRYLNGVVNGFLNDAKDYQKLSLPDMANFCYADYRFKKIISPYEAGSIVEENLKKLSAQKKLSLYNPLMKNLVYGAYAEDISRESSDYAAFYTTIPFRQLVMNGLTGVTTQNVNMSTKDSAYYVLQAVELGVYPKFTLTAKNVDVLKDSDYSYYYSTEYMKQKETIDKVYDECRAAWEKIGTMEITNHRQLMENVFQTEYASGVSVITNYNLHSVTIGGNEIAALGYLLIQK